MPNQIQPREYSKGGDMGDISYKADGNPNLLNANRNDNGQWLNTYYDKPDNKWNRDNSFAFAAQLSSFLLYYLVGEFCFVSWPFQPPSIRPISLSFSDKARYFLSSSDLVSHKIKRNTLLVSVFLIAILMKGSFSSRIRKEALEIASMISDSRLSIF